MEKIILSLLFGALVGFLLPSPTVFSNGGDQRVVEGKYLINLSRSPFTPSVGQKTSMLISFVDIKTNTLITDGLIAEIRIAKLGEIGPQQRNFIFKQDNIKVTRGILEFAYTFTETGLHEVFVDFVFAANPQKTYKPPDFLLDVQRQETSLKGSNLKRFSIIGGFIISFILGFLIKPALLKKAQID